VLRAGVPWPLLLAKELSCGSPVTDWRRLRDWQHRRMGAAAASAARQVRPPRPQVDWFRAGVDSLSVRAKQGCLTGPSPTDRIKPGSKYHLRVDRRGIPLAADRTTTSGLLCDLPVQRRPRVSRAHSGR
jgi:hypothetical protein